MVNACDLCIIYAKGKTQQQFDINQYALLTCCCQLTIGHTNVQEGDGVRMTDIGSQHSCRLQTRHSHNLIKKFFMFPSCPCFIPCPFNSITLSLPHSLSLSHNYLQCVPLSPVLRHLINGVNGRRCRSYCGFRAFCFS